MSRVVLALAVAMAVTACIDSPKPYQPSETTGTDAGDVVAAEVVDVVAAEVVDVVAAEVVDVVAAEVVDVVAAEVVDVGSVDAAADSGHDAGVDTVADTVADTGPDAPADACTPSCSGKFCGSDGCGGSCGQCGNGETCLTIGVCASGGGQACVDDAPLDPSDGCDSGVITPTRVNAHSDADQCVPDVAPLAGGGFVVVWQSCPDCVEHGQFLGGQDGEGCGVYAQMFSATGQPVAPSGSAGEPWLPVNSITEMSQIHASVAGSGDRFAVTWLSYAGNDGTDLGGWYVFAKAFDAAGESLGPDKDLQVSEFSANDSAERPVAVLSPDGASVALAWLGKTSQMGSDKVLVSRLSADSDKGLSAVLPPEVVYDQTENLWHVSVAGLDAQQFVVSWVADPPGDPQTGNDALAAFWNYVGSPGSASQSPFQLAEDVLADQTYASIASGPEGAFGATFIYDEGIAVRAFPPAPAVASSERKLLGFADGQMTVEPEIAVLPGSRLVVAWQSTPEENNPDWEWGIYLRTAQYTEDLTEWVKNGNVVHVTTVPDDSQTYPRITALEGGRYVVVWQEANLSGDKDHDIFAAGFNADGTRFQIRMPVAE